MSLRAQLIVPYVLLTLATAMVGTFIVTRLVTSSVRERFVNQLYEAGRVAADGIVRRERGHLETLRLMAFTAGGAGGVAAQHRPAPPRPRHPAPRDATLPGSKLAPFFWALESNLWSMGSSRRPWPT